MIDLDFSGDRKSSQELIENLSTPVEDGTYNLLITDAEVKPNKDSNKHPSLKVVLKVTDLEKKQVWKWFYLDPTNEISMAQVREFLEAVYSETMEGNVNLDPKDLIGRQVIGEVTQEARKDDANKMQNVVDVFYPVS